MQVDALTQHKEKGKQQAGQSEGKGEVEDER